MREDREFAGYVAARWPVLVRSLVLLGCPPHRAEEVVRTGLGRCCHSWDRVARADDVEVFAYQAVLGAWRRSRRTWVEPPSAAGPVPAARPGALLAQLDRLPPDPRAVLVLRFVAELSAAQVADVLDLPVHLVEHHTSTALDRLDLDAVRRVAG